MPFAVPPETTCVASGEMVPPLTTWPELTVVTGPFPEGSGVEEDVCWLAISILAFEGTAPDNRTLNGRSVV